MSSQTVLQNKTLNIPLPSTTALVAYFEKLEYTTNIFISKVNVYF